MASRTRSRSPLPQKMQSLSFVSLGDVVPGKGAKSVALTTPMDVPPVFMFPQSMEVIYEPTGYGGVVDASRVNLVLRPDEDVIGTIKDLETWAVAVQ